MPDSPIRPLNTRRARTFEESPRRNSILSDSLSEARNSIRSSTDDLFLPRVAKGHDAMPDEESNWQSAPLGLALLPAIAGIFFHEGSSFVTDVTLLVLAAIFLNWSVRLPWYVSSTIPLLIPQNKVLLLINYIKGTGTAQPKPSDEKKVDSPRMTIPNSSSTTTTTTTTNPNTKKRQPPYPSSKSTNSPL